LAPPVSAQLRFNCWPAAARIHRGASHSRPATWPRSSLHLLSHARPMLVQKLTIIDPHHSNIRSSRQLSPGSAVPIGRI
jgi:hypothetical protein